MISVKEVFELNSDTTVLVCDFFEDDKITGMIQSNIGNHKNFEVLPIRECFSKARTRNVVVRGEGDLRNVKSIQFR